MSSCAGPNGFSSKAENWLDRNFERRVEMKKAIRVMCVAAIVAVLGSGASADSFGTGGNQFTIDFVTISGSSNPASGYGIVAGDYRMGIHEITVGQWDKFNAELSPLAVTGSPADAYDTAPTWTSANIPVNRISLYEAMQFVNWLNTSKGYQAAYKFTGTQGDGEGDSDPYTPALWTPAEAAGGTNLNRHKDAAYFLPTEDEWVKAAYWNGTAIQAYATKDNSVPPEWTPNGGPQSNGQAAGWNYAYAYPTNNIAAAQPWDVTAGYCPEELNGTFDMMGNLMEWMESPYFAPPDYAVDSWRPQRGSSHFGTEWYLASTARRYGDEPNEGYDAGLRVASNVPDPCSSGLLALCGLAVCGRRRLR